MILRNKFLAAKSRPIRDGFFFFSYILGYYKNNGILIVVCEIILVL